jgi:hypothetical protein
VNWRRKREINENEKKRIQNKKINYLEVLFANFAGYVNLHGATSACQWAPLVRNRVKAANRYNQWTLQATDAIPVDFCNFKKKWWFFRLPALMWWFF